MSLRVTLSSVLTRRPELSRSQPEWILAESLQQLIEAGPRWTRVIPRVRARARGPGLE